MKATKTVVKKTEVTLTMDSEVFRVIRGVLGNNLDHELLGILAKSAVARRDRDCTALVAQARSEIIKAWTDLDLSDEGDE